MSKQLRQGKKSEIGSTTLERMSSIDQWPQSERCRVLGARARMARLRMSTHRHRECYRTVQHYGVVADDSRALLFHFTCLEALRGGRCPMGSR